MEELQIFKNEEFGEIRTVTINNEPWFVGKDIAEVLGYSNTGKAVSMHVDEEDRFLKTIESRSQNGNVVKTQASLINESGLYSLILYSKLPNAKKFKRWVTSDVLPSIRKHGMYATDDLLNDPDLAIRTFQALKEEKEKNKLLQADNEVMKPKAEFYDKVADSKTAIPMGDVAKILELGYGRNTLFKKLRERKILNKKNVPYQPYIDKGYFTVVEREFSCGRGERAIKPTTYVYQKGIEYIDKIVHEELVTKTPIEEYIEDAEEQTHVNISPELKEYIDKQKLKRADNKNELREKRNAKILEAYNAGLSYRQISEYMKCSKSLISQVVNKHNRKGE